MIRAYEKEVSWKAGGLAIAVHLVLLGALLISFNWKAAHTTLDVTEVELWDSIPNQAAPTPEPVVPPEPKPVVKEEIKPEPKLEPKPIVEEKPKEEPQVDIALEKKKKELALKKADEQLKKDKVLEQKKQLEALKLEALKDEAKPPVKVNKTSDALKRLQQEALAEEKTAGDQQAIGAKAAANAGAIGEFTDKIKAKIRGNVNKTLCGEGNPELKFEIGLLPTGELNGSPKLVKSSGSAACDEAVERAIMASEPLPLPKDPSLFSQFRNLNLKFRPND
ncbi:MAG: cell envelope integrity protein TolA [Methylotenera sp.]|uniref:cell envelope integrity protein TolA n=1 Tax=Methylotenera sp. TaxID=2051956 RepID=UPI002486EAD9|nr:cell envelope integrity protein TolA [Methylotenera sp.]MDI1308650.1 cell envelope integrity protein TolA [Methylotenera sp.]